MFSFLRRWTAGGARAAVVAGVICVLCGTLGAQSAPGSSVLISAQELQRGLSDPNLVLLYVGPHDQYLKEHIPGAQFVDLSDISVNDASRHLTLELPDEADLRARLERFGINDKSRIVVTPGADWGSPSTRLVWTLQAAGLGAQTRLLDGGTTVWKASGYTVTTTVPSVTPGHLTVAADRSVLVDYKWIETHEHASHVRIIDARSPVFFEGPGMPEHNSPGGHIPGAKNLPFDKVFNDSVHFFSPAELRKQFDAAGVAPGDTVAAYCHVGQQATAVLFAARILGHPIRLYDGSMNDWQERKLPLEGGAAPAKQPNR